MKSLLFIFILATNVQAANITNNVSLLNISSETAVFSTLDRPQSIRCVNAAGTGYESCAGSGGHSDGTNAPSGFLCLGVDASGNCQTALIDASAVDSSTNPVQSNFLFDHDADASAHHSQTTANDDAADASFALFQGTHSADASAHHTKTVSSEIDHDSITGVSTSDHHAQTTANDDAADASFAVFQGTHSADASAHHAKTVSSEIDHDSITGVSTSDHHAQTVNSNSETICSATEYLEGDGTCDVLATGAHTTANDDAADTAFALFQGTHSADVSAHHTATVDTFVTNKDTHDHLGGDGATIPHSSIGSVGSSDHHAQTTANDDVADASFAVFQGTHSSDVSAHHVQTVDTFVTNKDTHDHNGGDGADIDHANLTNVTASQHHTATVDTNASTICTGTDFLNGSGSCVVGGGGHGDGTNATSGNVCLGVDASGNCQEAVVDALAVDTSTNPVQSNALFDHDADASAHHTKTTDASELVTGTLPDGRFPAILPTASGENLTGFVVSASSLTSPGQNINNLSYVGIGTTTITLRGGRPVLILLSALVNNDTTGTRTYDVAITFDGTIIGSIESILVPKNNAEITVDRHSYSASFPAGVHDFSVLVRSDSTNNTQIARDFRLTILEF